MIPKYMTGEQYAEALRTVGGGVLDTPGFSRPMGIHRRTTHRWLETGPPNWVAVLLWDMIEKGQGYKHLQGLRFKYYETPLIEAAEAKKEARRLAKVQREKEKKQHVRGGGGRSTSKYSRTHRAA